MNLGERLRWLIDATGCQSVNRAAPFFGIPQPTLDRWVKQTTEPKPYSRQARQLEGIADLCGIPRSWLRDGNGRRPNRVIQAPCPCCGHRLGPTPVHRDGSINLLADYFNKVGVDSA